MVLAVVLVVVVGLAVLRLGRSTPDTAPRPDTTPAGVSSPTPDAWPVDLPPGTLFAAAGGWVYTIDAGSGALTRTSVRTGVVGTSMTFLAHGVLVWRQGTGAKQLLLGDGPGSSPVRGELRTGTSFLPGPDGLVWATAGRRSGSTVWRLVDVGGRATRSVSIQGSVVGDGAGGLLGVDQDGVRPLFPSARRSRRAGEVIATGPAGYVLRSCAETDCRFTLHRRGDDTDTNLDTAVGEETSGGTLSPANRLLAVTETVGGTSTLRVSVVATGEVKFIFPTPKQSTNDAVWLDDRWIALISEDQLVLYDADDDRVVTPAVPLSGIGPLAWRAA